MPPAPDDLNSTGTAPPAESKIEHPKSKLQRLLAYRTLWLLAAGVLALDQLTKAWITTRLPLGTYRLTDGAIPVVRGFFHLVHAGNTGAAWSMFSGRGVWLGALAALTLGAIFWWRHTLNLRDRLPQLCFGLLCGGIAGNLVDRLHHADGHVTDFLDFHFGAYVYPTFNVADSGICVGVILYLLHSLREPK